MIQKNNIKFIGEKSKNKKKWELKKEEPWLSKVGNCWNANWVLEKGDSELLQVDDYPPSFDFWKQILGRWKTKISRKRKRFSDFRMEPDQFLFPPAHFDYWASKSKPKLLP